MLTGRPTGWASRRTIMCRIRGSDCVPDLGLVLWRVGNQEGQVAESVVGGPRVDAPAPGPVTPLCHGEEPAACVQVTDDLGGAGVQDVQFVLPEPPAVVRGDD